MKKTLLAMAGFLACSLAAMPSLASELGEPRERFVEVNYHGPCADMFSECEKPRRRCIDDDRDIKCAPIKPKCGFDEYCKEPIEECLRVGGCDRDPPWQPYKWERHPKGDKLLK